MALQARELAFRTSNALQQSILTKSLTIKETTNFPLSVITALDPSLKHKFETRKTLTKRQSKMYRNDMTFNTSTTNTLVIESEDQSTIDKVNDLSRYVHHHSAVNFFISISDKFSKHTLPPTDISLAQEMLPINGSQTVCILLQKTRIQT